MATESAERRGRVPVIYGAALAHRGGTGVYLRRLLRGLVELEAPVRVVCPGGALTARRALSASDWPQGVSKVLFEHFRAPRTARVAEASVVHLPAFGGAPPRGCPYVVTVHDMAYLARPSWFPAVRSLYYRMSFSRTARGADLVMVDSRFSGAEAVRLAGVAEDAVRTVYLSADNSPEDSRPLLERLGLSSGYLLFVGTVEPRKNLTALLDAMRIIRRSRPNLKLLVAGRWGWGPAELRRRLTSQPGVLWPGPLGARDLRRAYCGAGLLVYPSLYEGFGLPPLEAARVGVPSVVGPAKALAEVYRNAAFHSGADARSIALTVEEALDSPAPGGMEALARRLTNARMAEEVLEVYEEVAS